ncbi:MAG: hypothetical protein HKN13_01480 [Rhodothermales bacterium]|nr:hypothetical protein [Rhodothermales bacterium]
MIKELAFQKGWVGKTISRAETVERLNPIIREHILLNRSHDAVIRSIDDAEGRQILADAQKIARANVGKIAETIYSCGGVAFNGTEVEPDDFDLGTGVAALDALQKLEASLLETLDGESNIEHQMRTRAIIGVLKESTEERLKSIRSLTKKMR